MFEWIPGFVVSLQAAAPSILSFLINYCIHSSVLLLLAIIGVKLHWLKGDASGERLLKSSVVLGLFSALVLQIRPAGFDLTWHIQEQNSTAQNLPLDGYPQSRQGSSSDIEASHGKVTRVQSREGQTQETQLVDVTASEQFATRITSGQSDLTSPQAGENFNNTNADSLARLSFWVVLYWLIGVAIMLVLHGYQRVQLRKMMQHKTPLKDVMLLSGLASLKHQADYKSDIRLYSSSVLVSPVVLNSKEIVLPKFFVTRYSLTQQQAALAHELAHLKRKDMRWQQLFQYFDILFFFQPLNKLIRREIYQMVEQRADAMASEWTGDPRALAEALSVTAKQTLGTRHRQWVLAMKCEKSNLLVRVENLLKGGVEKTRTVATASLAIFWSLILISGPGISLSTPTSVFAAPQPALPASQAKPDSDEESLARSTSSSSHSFSFSEIEDDNGVGNMNIAWSTDNTSWDLTSTLTGKIRFDDEETQIIDFPQDSELEVRIDDGTDKRRLKISRDKGHTEYAYYVNRKQKDIADDPLWLAEFIPELLRMTGWNAKERTAKLFARGGLSKVLDEVKLIKGEEAKAKYLILLPELKAYTAKEVDMIFQSLAVIRSDFQKSRTIRSLFRNIRFEDDEWFTDNNWQTLMAATADIESDMEMARVMRSVVMAVPLESGVWPSVFAQLQSIQSDFELAKLLSELISHRPLQQVQLSEMLKLSRTIESDFELSNLLIHMTEHLDVPEYVTGEWLDSANTLQSDFEMSRTLKARIVNKMSVEALVQIIRMARDEIQSDFELAGFFRVLIDQQPITNTVRDELYDALNEVQSDHEKESLIKAFRARNI